MGHGGSLAYDHAMERERMKILSGRENFRRSESGNSLHHSDVTVISWDTLFEYWLDGSSPLDWNCIFMLPPWLKAWWVSFGGSLNPYICSVRYQGRVIGIAPLTVEGDGARLMGSSDLSDYVDFIIAPGYENIFLGLLFEYLRGQGIRFLDAGHQRNDSSIVSEQRKNPGSPVFEAPCDPAGRIYELNLPRTWDEYLDSLSGKERHEIRRKIRRLEEAGRISCSVVKDREEVSAAMDIFIRLFRSNRVEKTFFMNAAIESFFRGLADAMAEFGFVRLFLLKIDDTYAAAALCFDYLSTMYLYNNGYDKEYSPLSVGFISKVFSIRHGISMGREKYDFLKGDEAYKGRLGGMPVKLYRCLVTL